jgi:hypothetical protein
MTLSPIPRVFPATIWAGMVVIILTVLAGQARGQGETAFLFSVAGKSCGEYLQAAEGEQKIRPAHPSNTGTYSSEYLMFASFADGYLTGVNTTLRSLAGSNTDLSGRMAWLEGYCRQNPLDLYINALSALRRYLIAHRQ